jgi:nucleoside-diphosphate-sugar epimerase
VRPRRGLRTDGTANLLDAARAAGARRYIGQSGTFFYAPVGGSIKDESAPFWTACSDLATVVLRYGGFYGPGTWFSRDGAIARQMARRQLPNIGRGEGRTSFVHVHDAADVCAEFVDRGSPGVYNVVDDEPATANEWMPVFAGAIVAHVEAARVRGRA